jgi:hypothetical protein
MKYLAYNVLLNIEKEVQDMNQNEIIHPMNREEALVARFQFLQVPHGDGLDMNEPSYVERVQDYLKGLTENDITEIIKMNENSALRMNLYVIPFIYARYKIIPELKLLQYFKDIMYFYNDDPNNRYIRYFYNNIEDILNQRKSDVPPGFNILKSIGLGILLAGASYIIITVLINIIITLS